MDPSILELILRAGNALIDPAQRYGPGFSAIRQLEQMALTDPVSFRYLLGMATGGFTPGGSNTLTFPGGVQLEAAYAVVRLISGLEGGALVNALAFVKPCAYKVPALPLRILTTHLESASASGRFTAGSFSEMAELYRHFLACHRRNEQAGNLRPYPPAFIRGRLTRQASR